MENSLYCAAALIFTGVGAVWGVTAAAAKGRLPIHIERQVQTQFRFGGLPPCSFRQGK